MSEIDNLLDKFKKKSSSNTDLYKFFVQMGTRGFYPLLHQDDISLVSELDMQMNQNQAKKYFNHFLKNSKNHESVQRKKMFLETRQVEERLLVTKALLTLVESQIIDLDESTFH